MARASRLRDVFGSFLLMAAVAPAIASQNCKPVTGSFEATVVPPGQGHCPATPGTFCTAGRVWGGIQGSYCAAPNFRSTLI